MEGVSVVQASALFSGFSAKEIEHMLTCMDAEKKEYDKGAYLLHVGEKVRAIGMLLSGSAHVVEEDFWGNRNIIIALEAGEIFAESYAFAGGAPLQVDVIAQEPATVLYIDTKKLLTPCQNACDFHSELIYRLVGMLAQKNLFLTEKLRHVTRRSTREKLLSYLSAESARNAKPDFSIPFDRQQLADYLAVERSAMSAELGKLRKEGVLSFQRNRFTLLKKEE
ncbi:MAG: Crp/Fnr family transcriptional regulator [Eubacteriales bacterium]|nr:Crp/Fnr family transcriptional regulator [Eubacteriales bacterium]